MEEEEEGCEWLSIYLAALDAANLPDDFIYSTAFKLSLINQVDHKRTITDELQDLWDELGVFGFDDLTWLEPHVQSALSMKEYVESEEKVTKLKGHVVHLEDKIKSLKANVAAAKSDLEGAKFAIGNG
ncbi:hypothetical protein PIB30_020581 [Stylosanthes scabra]|uniref:Uncharacterized protein n=1 Tax=Stylosanthes scabra TaxID=79078 RepID=A0ABU6Q8F4_9FABA|nr:hypothetical protein [Stylosanthes scabra]